MEKTRDLFKKMRDTKGFMQRWAKLRAEMVRKRY